MTKRNRILVIAFTLALSVSFSGCGLSAEEELQLTEEKLDEALNIGAENIARDEYRSAQEQFVKAMEHFRDGDTHTAKVLAKRARLRAEDAIMKVERHEQSLEDEENRRDFDPNLR